MNIGEILKKPVVYRIPGMENASVVQNRVYREVNGEKLTLDVYYPAGYDGETPLPAIIFIHGDAPWERLRTIKDSGQYTSWGQLVAASGMIGITFTHRSSEGFTDFQSPTEDILNLFTYVQEHSEELHIHPKQIGVWVCSAGGPSSLTAVLRSTPDWLKCIVSYYALMDLHGLREHFGEKAELIEQFSATHHLKDNSAPIPPMLVVRADLDRPVFNDSIDRFVQVAQQLGHAITFINHPNGQHAFDILDDDETSRQIIKDTLVFIKDAVTSVD